MSEAKGMDINMDIAPEAIDGRAVVPLRFVGESLGAEVRWELASNRVMITDKSSVQEKVNKTPSKKPGPSY